MAENLIKQDDAFDLFSTYEKKQIISKCILL